MSLRRNLHKTRASLIDRLVDLAPRSDREVRPLRTLGRKFLRESVCRDLSWLLNTRTQTSEREFSTRSLTVIDFGIPDLGLYSTANHEDRTRLAHNLKKGISAFEPRLKDLSVRVDPEMLNEKSLRVFIKAVIEVDNVREPVSFLTVWDADIRVWALYEEDPY